MGDVETQGVHFEVALIKVIDEMNPSDYNEWLECVGVTVETRNSQMKSPNQLVFGRDPEYPGDDILAEARCDDCAILSCGAAFSSQSSAGIPAARIAFNSRPRPHREFQPGDEVAIWRRGRGIKKSTARWRGPGIVAGSAGGNYWVSMPGALVKCAPEQIRLRTAEEREADRFLVRDLRAASAALFPEVGLSNRTQNDFCRYHTGRSTTRRPAFHRFRSDPRLPSRSSTTAVQYCWRTPVARTTSSRSTLIK